MPRIDVLVLSCLARLPMHGYEVKLELQFRHVRWWAKCEHGHLYAALKRLEKDKLIKGATKKHGKRSRRVFTITPAGRRHLKQALGALASAADETYFDIDLFLSATFTLKQDEVVALLRRRAATLADQQRQASELLRRMGAVVPAVGRLIMQHRLGHLKREIEFTHAAAHALEAETTWGPFLGKKSITEFLARTAAELET